MFSFYTIIKGDTITYLFIFFLKIIENALATLRIIVIANGKKLLGAFLNFLMSFSWIFSTSLVIVDIQKDPLKVLIYSFGTFLGSYLGSLLEEKLALGSNMIIAIINPEKETIPAKIREQHYSVLELSGIDINSNKKVLVIPTTRKKQRRLIHLIKRLDRHATIMIDNAYFPK